MAAMICRLWPVLQLSLFKSSAKFLLSFYFMKINQMFHILANESRRFRVSVYSSFHSRFRFMDKNTSTFSAGSFRATHEVFRFRKQGKLLCFWCWSPGLWSVFLTWNRASVLMWLEWILFIFVCSFRLGLFTQVRKRFFC